MTKLLTLKHWHLFSFMVLIPVIVYAIAIGVTISSNDPAAFLIAIPLLMVFCYTLFFVWLYTLGTSLHKKLPPGTGLSLGRFKAFLIIPAAYILLMAFFIFYIVSTTIEGSQPDPVIFAVIVPLHLFSMFCILHSFYFVARALKSVEWQKPAALSDYLGEFFLIWFFPLGIWFLQPRINQLFSAAGGSGQEQAG